MTSPLRVHSNLPEVAAGLAPPAVRTERQRPSGTRPDATSLPYCFAYWASVVRVTPPTGSVTWTISIWSALRSRSAPR